MLRAEQECLACDLVIVLGSSLTVYPAAGFPALAVNNGASMVIVNQQETDMDGIAEQVLHCPIGDTLDRVLPMMKEYS